MQTKYKYACENALPHPKLNKKGEMFLTMHLLSYEEERKKNHHIFIKIQFKSALRNRQSPCVDKVTSEGITEHHRSIEDSVVAVNLAKGRVKIILLYFFFRCPSVASIHQMIMDMKFYRQNSHFQSHMSARMEEQVQIVKG